MIIMPCFFKTFSYENENEKTINLKKRSEKMGGGMWAVWDLCNMHSKMGTRTMQVMSIPVHR